LFHEIIKPLPSQTDKHTSGYNIHVAHEKYESKIAAQARYRARTTRVHGLDRQAVLTGVREHANPK